MVPAKLNKTAEEILKHGKASSAPKDIEPMLATLVTQPVTENGWIYEMKWDGYRAVAYMQNGEVDICSRNNKSFNQKFYPLYETLQQWNINAVVDGEIVVVNEQGVPSFSDLQLWRGNNGIGTPDFFLRRFLNKRYILPCFVIDIMSFFKTKCFESFNLFMNMFNGEGFVKHSRILMWANIRLLICSSGKSNGQNCNDKNDSSSPNENSNTVNDERKHRVLFVKAQDCFHR